MKITVLTENTTCDPALACEHGLSLYIETAEHKILFDMGQTDAFAENAHKMGMDLTQIDLAILSHGHYDHGGGLARFLEINDKAPVYISIHGFDGHYNGSHKDIGLRQRLKEHPRLRFTDKDVSLDPTMDLYMAEGREGIYPLDPAGLQMAAKGGDDGETTILIPEDFRHEQYLMIQENGKKILFSGCSHRGIWNIMEWFQPDVLIGGFHFSKMDPEGAGKDCLDQAARILGGYDATYYTCHCTGEKQYAYLKEQMGETLQYLATGQVLVL